MERSMQFHCSNQMGNGHLSLLYNHEKLFEALEEVYNIRIEAEKLQRELRDLRVTAASELLELSMIDSLYMKAVLADAFKAAKEALIINETVEIPW